MKEAKIILPLFDNDGAALHREIEQIEYELLCEFGGYSAVNTRGAWRDQATGKVYHDSHVTYTLAARWDDLVDCGGLVKADILLNIAAKAATIMRQVCIYVALPDGVQFVEPAEAAAVA